MNTQIRMTSLRMAAALAVATLLSGGCATRVGAPVSDRMPKEAAAAPAAARPGHYVVQAGDTLHRIARQFGVTPGELAEWNRIADPHQLDVGVELRVTPPTTVQIQPVAPSAPVEVTPITGSSPVAAPPVVKTAPLGGVRPYSDEAWAAAQAAAGVVATAPKAPEQEVAAPASAQSRTVEAIEWSWPAAGKVVGGYSDKAARKGLDIAGKTGDAVLAAASGKVVYAGTGLRGYGKLVIIKHDASFLSAYAHNDELLVKEGDSVTRGQLIAKLGSSDSDRPKLHFEVRRQGKPVDPSDYLPTR